MLFHEPSILATERLKFLICLGPAKDEYSLQSPCKCSVVHYYPLRSNNNDDNNTKKKQYKAL